MPRFNCQPCDGWERKVYRLPSGVRIRLIRSCTRMAGFNGRSSIVIGTGMIPRGEMALITAQIGFSQHILSDDYYSTIIFTISLVTLIAPLFLKAALHGAPARDDAAEAGSAKAEAAIETESEAAGIIDVQAADAGPVGATAGAEATATVA